MMRNQTPILGEKNETQRTLDTAYMERAENILLDEQKVRAFVVKPQLQKEYITVTSSQILLRSSFPTLTSNQRWSGLQFMRTPVQFSTNMKTIQSKLQIYLFFYFLFFKYYNF